MSARGRDGGGESPEPMAGEDLVSLLYGELEPEEAARLGARVASDAAMSAQLGEMRRVRDLFSAMEEEEPPSRLTAQLLAEAARSAPQARRAAAPAAEGGFWARLISWLQPLAQRPALAAAASLVLVAGVAGVLYMKKGDELTSTAPGAERAEPVEATAPGAERAEPVEATPPATAAPQGAQDSASLADGDEAAAPAPEEAAKSESAAGGQPTAKRRKAGESKISGTKKAYEKAPPRPGLKSGTVYGLSEQEMVPADQAPAAGEGGGGAQKKSDDAPAAPAPPPEPAPSTAPTTDGKASARPSARELHDRAVDAALDRRCAEVKMLAGQVRATDAVYYAKSFAGDKRLQSCLASPTRSPSKK